MSADKYPLPAHACSIWAAGDNLMVAFPGVATEQGHTIKLPLSEGGLRAVVSILRERSVAQDLRLSQRGTPSQWEADKLAAWGKALKRDRDERVAKLDAERAEAARERDEAAEFLKELGL
jgi:hypothetical protein